MNRSHLLEPEPNECIPHTRGDEPHNLIVDQVETFVFPTRVGMNRPVVISTTCLEGIPHTRGDEPVDRYLIHSE